MNILKIIWTILNALAFSVVLYAIVKEVTTAGVNKTADLKDWLILGGLAVWLAGNILLVNL